jgi:hypothetical protein
MTSPNLELDKVFAKYAGKEIVMYSGIGHAGGGDEMGTQYYAVNESANPAAADLMKEIRELGYNAVFIAPDGSNHYVSNPGRILIQLEDLYRMASQGREKPVVRISGRYTVE